MADVGVHLNYFLPLTEFLVTVTERDTVRTTEHGSVVDTVADVAIAPAIRADRDAPARVVIDASWLEKIDLKITLDDTNVITAVNSTAGRDIAPVVSLVGKLISVAPVLASGGLAAATALLPAELDLLPGGASLRQPDNSLEVQWAVLNPALSGARGPLQDRAQTLLVQLADPQASAGETLATAKALDAVQKVLADIGRHQREWIAGHARVVSEATLRLRPSELVRIDATELPDELVGGAEIPQTIAAGLPEGILLVIADSERRPDASGPPPATRDRVALRRSRPVEVAVYEEADGVWRIRPETLARLDVVDEFSPTDQLPVEGRWRRTRTFELAYHPDMSLKTFGVVTESSASTVAPAVGEVLDAAAKVKSDAASAPSEDEVELERITLQRDLLKTSLDLDALSATSYAATELAIMKQGKEIRDSLK